MSAWRGGGAYAPRGFFPPPQPLYHGDELESPIIRMPLAAARSDPYGSFGASIHPPDQRRVGILLPGPAEMFVEPHQRVAPALLRPNPVPPPASGSVVYKVNQSKSLPNDIQSILTNASRAGNLSAADGFKLRSYYEKLSDNVKVTFYQHMVKFLGVGDADLIAGRPALIPDKKTLPESATQMPPYSGDCLNDDEEEGYDEIDDEIDLDLTPGAAAGSPPGPHNSARQLPPLIVPTKVHSVDRKVKALERQREKLRAMPKAHHDDVMDYKADELPGVTFDKDGKATFNGFTVRWIRQMLYILYRNGKGGDKGADQFLKRMEEFYGPEVIKQVNPEKQMTRLKNAEEKAGKEVVQPSSPAEAARIEEVKRLHRITHNLKLETVVGLNGNETRCGLTPETVGWIRENVLAMLRVKMNPDKFLRRIGGMFGLPAMDIAWADKPFAVAMQKLTPEMPEGEKPVKLLKLAAAAYKKAFGIVLPGTDPHAAEEEEEEKEEEKTNSARQTAHTMSRPLPHRNPAETPMSHSYPSAAPAPRPLGYIIHPHPRPGYGNYGQRPPFGHRPPPPPPPTFNYDYDYHYRPQMPIERGPMMPPYVDYLHHPTAHARHQPYPPPGGSKASNRGHVRRGTSGRALKL